MLWFRFTSFIQFLIELNNEMLVDKYKLWFVRFAVRKSRTRSQESKVNNAIYNEGLHIIIHLTSSMILVGVQVRVGVGMQGVVRWEWWGRRLLLTARLVQRWVWVCPPPIAVRWWTRNTLYYTYNKNCNGSYKLL